MIVPAAPAILTPTGPAEPGDTVGLFSSAGTCLGSATLDGGAVAVVVWADDPFTSEVDGFSEGEVPELRVFDASEETLHTAGVGASYKGALDPSQGLSSGMVYAIEDIATPYGETNAWVSEVGAADAAYVEVAVEGAGPLWLAGLDDGGLVRWTADLSSHTPNGDGLVVVRADDVGVAPAQFLSPLERPGAVVLTAGDALTGGGPDVGTLIAGVALEDAVVVGGRGVHRGDSLLSLLGQTVQYVAGGPLSRAREGALLLAAPPTPSKLNKKPAPVPKPDMTSPAEAFHLLSFPVLDASREPLAVGDLGALGPLVGVPGSGAPLADPNVWTGFDAEGLFTAPASVDVMLPPGRGVVWTWPAAEAVGATAASPFAPVGPPIDDAADDGPRTVSFAEPSPDGHYLVGNPYPYPLRLEGLSADGGTLQSSLAVWDPVDGTYVDLFVGDTTGAGTLPVWAGVVAEVTEPDGGDVVFSSTSSWVDPTAAPPSAPSPGRLSLRLSGVLEDGRRVSDRSAHVRFVEGATPAWDVHDASKLTPPTDAHALVAFVGERGGQPRRQRVLSVAPGTLSSTPVAFSATHAGSFRLDWSGGGDLEGLELVDHETGDAVDLDGPSGYTFRAEGPTSWTDRFEVRPVASPPAPTSSGALADRFEVGSPYPNPTVGTATVHVRSAGPADVSADVFDLVGRRVGTASVHPSGGGVDVRVDAQRFSAGLYVVVVRAGAETSTQRFSVVR